MNTSRDPVISPPLTLRCSRGCSSEYAADENEKISFRKNATQRKILILFIVGISYTSIMQKSLRCISKTVDLARKRKNGPGGNLVVFTL